MVEYVAISTPLSTVELRLLDEQDPTVLFELKCNHTSWIPKDHAHRVIVQPGFPHRQPWIVREERISLPQAFESECADRQFHDPNEQMQFTFLFRDKRNVTYFGPVVLKEFKTILAPLFSNSSFCRYWMFHVVETQADQLLLNLTVRFVLKRRSLPMPKHQIVALLQLCGAITTDEQKREFERRCANIERPFVTLQTSDAEFLNLSDAFTNQVIVPSIGPLDEPLDHDLFPIQKTAVRWLRACIANNQHLMFMCPIIRASTVSPDHHITYCTQIICSHDIPCVYALMMPTGAGKTVVTLRSMLPHERWLVIVPTTLAGQWLEEANKWRRGTVADDHLRVRKNSEMANKKTVIVTWSMIQHVINNPSHWDGIVIDEAHEVQRTSAKWKHFNTIWTGCPVVLLSATLTLKTLTSFVQEVHDKSLHSTHLDNINFMNHVFRSSAQQQPYQVHRVVHSVVLTSPIDPILQYCRIHMDGINAYNQLHEFVQTIRHATAGTQFSVLERLRSIVESFDRRVEAPAVPLVNIPFPTSVYFQNPCPICYDEIQRPAVFKRCGHVYCHRCLELLFDAHHPHNPMCPTCRTRTHAGFVNEIAQLEQPGQQQAPVVVEEQPVNAENAPQQGKISWLIHFLQTIDVSTTKVVLVTDFPDVLPMIERLLDRQRWPCFTIQTTQGQEQRSRLLKQFTEFPRGAFLIGRRTVIGQGLNLTAATHLISWEPEFDKADQMQCEGRLDRIGQTVDVTIHKLITEQSIEPLMEQWAQSQHCRIKKLNSVRILAALRRLLYNFSHRLRTFDSALLRDVVN